MGNVTELKLGKLNGLYRQTNECIDSAYRRGYDDGRIAEYQRGLEDGNRIANKDLKEIQDSTYDVAYNKALKDVNHAMAVINAMTGAECAELFEGRIGVTRVFCEFTVEHIIKVIKTYEEKKKAEEEIKVGDEVKTEHGENPAVVTKVEGRFARLMFEDGSGFRVPYAIEGWIKTGRHFDEVEQLLGKLRGEDDNISSTGDGICGPEISLDVDGEMWEKEEDNDLRDDTGE